MVKKKPTLAESIAIEEGYVAFLRKRLDSENYKMAVSPEEYAKTKQKLDKAKFRLKTMKMGH